MRPQRPLRLSGKFLVKLPAVTVLRFFCNSNADLFIAEGRILLVWATSILCVYFLPFNFALVPCDFYLKDESIIELPTTTLLSNVNGE